MTAASRARALADSIRATKAELPPETWCCICGLATAGTNYCATCDAALAAYVPPIGLANAFAGQTGTMFVRDESGVYVGTPFVPTVAQPAELPTIASDDHATHLALEIFPVLTHFLPSTPEEIAHIQQHAILAKIAPEVLHDQLADERSVTPEEE